MTLQERLVIYLEENSDRHNTKWLKSRDPLLWSDIKEATNFLPETAAPKQRCWHIENQIWSIPLCQVDNIPRKWCDNRYLTYSSQSAKNRCEVQLTKRTNTQRVNKESAIGRPMSEREQYRKDVWRHTKRNWSHHKTKIENYDLRSRDFHLDHIYSLDDGFKNAIAPEIIGSWINFRILSAADNLAKHMKSDITKEELLQRYQSSIQL